MTPEQQRQPDGTFAKGTSGNPKGRPKSEIIALRKQIAPQAEAIIQQVIDQALAGDLTAAKIILDRVLPPLNQSPRRSLSRATKGRVSCRRLKASSRLRHPGRSPPTLRPS